MNNYIVTFEYRVMVTAFAILAMFMELTGGGGGGGGGGGEQHRSV